MTTFTLPTEDELRPPPSKEEEIAAESPAFAPKRLPEIWEDIVYRPDENDISPGLATKILDEWAPKFEPFDDDCKCDLAWRELEKRIPMFEKMYGPTAEYRRIFLEERKIRLISEPIPQWVEQYPEPWKQMVDPHGVLETDQQFSAFSAYLKLGIHRTIRAAVAATNQGQPNLAIQTVYEQWAKMWVWDDRARAFDRHIAKRQTDHLATLKTQAQYKMHENMLKLAELNSKILSEGVTGDVEKVVGALALMKQTETMDQATRMYTALHGSKTEVKGEMNVNLAHAILTAAPNTINI